MGFATNLKTLRKGVGLTHRALADKLAVSDLAARRWEQGKREPKIPDLAGIAKALKCNLQDLL